MRTLVPASLALILLVGCTGKEPADTDDTAADGPLDADADGITADTDCDDDDATVFPGAEEHCNDRDDDCDGTVDEEAVDLATLYVDADGDGFGNPDAALSTCDSPAGYVTNADDCDDMDLAVSPAATEVCDAADVDENCSGAADDADTAVDTATGSTWYLDADADGFGDDASAFMACDVADGRVATPGDCDDADAAVRPDAVERCDDADVDDDCDGAAEDADADVDLSTGSTWYQDGDADGYGAPGASTATCDVPAGYVADASDCDDARAEISPAATELCDEADTDEDCDGLADNADPGAPGESTWYVDADEDGFGDPTVAMSACDQPDAYVADATDCDDGAGAVYPAAPEFCDGTANDCDTRDTWTADAEAGTGSWIDAAGAWSSVTSILTGGTIDAPAAWTAPGDGELRLCDGTYYALVDGTGVDLVVSSQNGSASTTLDGGDAGTVLSSVEGALTASGLTVRNGAAANGGGVYCLASDLVLEDVVVQVNEATTYGGGVFLQSCANATLTDVQLSENKASSGAGLYATTSDGLVLDGLAVTGNEATVVGGGLVLSNADFTLTDSVVSENVAGRGYAAGGISVSSSTGLLEGVTVSDNTAATAAGLLVAVSTVDLVDSVVSGNVATGQGGAIHAYYRATVTVEGTTFTANVSGSDAPIVLDTDTVGTFSACTFTLNEGVDGGVFAFEGTSSAAIVASDFSDNAPNDAWAAGTAYTFGSAASATCDESLGCY